MALEQITDATGVLPAGDVRRPLFGTQATRDIEAALAQQLAPHTLMQRAGAAVARLALAIAPHARCIWIACGPGNNGGDGFEAAMHLHKWGKDVTVGFAGDTDRLPDDARQSWRRALAAGVRISDQVPELGPHDLAIDAMLGIGTRRPVQGAMREWLDALSATRAQVLCVDLPTGLNADTGTPVSEGDAWWRQHPAALRHTLSLLTLKPGLFTAQGRDAAGTIWFDPLQTRPDANPDAWLNAPASPRLRPHASHKGRHGDVAVVGGADGMAGAAVLAAQAALQAGAGRVWWHMLAAPSVAPNLPADIMVRSAHDDPIAPIAPIAPGATVVCGCGGGDAVAGALAPVLASAHPLVLDADALNAIAAHPSLQDLLRQRARQHRASVITPHPLEAARLLGCSAADVQADRLAAAHALADRLQCCVVLKGSGSVIAAPGMTPVINPSGNARLAIAGTGDVLAGLIGARVAQAIYTAASADSVFSAVCAAVWEHGAAAEHWRGPATLTASDLARQLVPGA